MTDGQPILQPATGELIERDLVARHRQLKEEFVNGVCGMCVALYWIRAEQTYKAEGHDSFKSFLSSVGLSETNGRRYASCGPMLMELQQSAELAVIKHPDMLRPIASMLTSKQPPEQQRKVAKRQAAIVRLAATRARARQVPLDEELIAEVAEKNFGWLSRGAYQKRQQLNRAAQAALPVPAEKQRQQMLEDIERAFAVIIGYRRTGYELVRELGDPSQWLGFDDVMTILSDARDST